MEQNVLPVDSNDRVPHFESPSVHDFLQSLRFIQTSAFVSNFSQRFPQIIL